MGTLRKTLGQTQSAAATDATLYTVPAATDTVISSIVMCETNGAVAKVKVTIDAAGGAVTAAAKSIAWSMPVAANDTAVLQFGGTLAAGTTVVVQSDTGKVTFTLYGQENT